jgi:hypothetical protein
MSTVVLGEDRYAGHYGLRHAVRGELIKLFSLRSTKLTLVVTLLGALGVTAAATATEGNRQFQGFDATNQSMTGLILAILSVGVLGAMVATGEHATGTIRSTLAAVPRRPLLLLAKITVVAAVAVVSGEVVTFSCFGLGQAILAAVGAPSASLGQPGVLRALTLSGVLLATLGLLALALGVVIRHTAGAISAYVGVTFLVPFLISRLPNQPSRFTPVPILANSVSATIQQPGQVSPEWGVILVALYAAGALALATAMIVRRDT